MLRSKGCPDVIPEDAAMADNQSHPDDRADDALTQEMAEHQALNRAGLAADVVVHEFSNMLNAILLQAAVLQQKAAEPLRSELSRVRDQGRLAADLMRQLQHYRRGCQPASYPIDLNRVARAAAIAPKSGPALVLELATDLPAVSGTFADLKLLAVLLVNSAVAVTPPGGTVRISTSRDGERVRLHVADGGPPLASDVVARLFDPYTRTREGVNPLDMAACQTLARRLQGVIHAENRADGVTLVVEMRIA
jgi:signal transduction histidine kinase